MLKKNQTEPVRDFEDIGFDKWDGEEDEILSELEVSEG